MTIQRSGAILITGCSSGIGRAIAREFTRRGEYPVVATARRVESLAEIEQPACRTLTLDVTDSDSIDLAVAKTLEWHGGLHMLINNAGWGLMGPVAELDLTDLRAQFETNVFGTVALVNAVVPHMAQRHSGVIVNVGSVSGVTASPFAGAYCASKAALHALTDSLRMEVAPFGIAVVSLQPGAVLSDFGSTASGGLGRFASEASLYRRFAASIQARARVSQSGGISADAFAREVVGRLSRPNPPPVIRCGPLSQKLPLLGRLPVRWRDHILSRKFGLG